MLNNLTVNNYKCLVECSLELKPLNLFAGPNSSGKSTALQALLIASDNVTEQKGKHGLKNRRTEASNFNDVRNFVTNAKSYEIVFRIMEKIRPGFVLLRAMIIPNHFCGTIG